MSLSIVVPVYNSEKCLPLLGDTVAWLVSLTFTVRSARRVRTSVIKVLTILLVSDG